MIIAKTFICLLLFITTSASVTASYPVVGMHILETEEIGLATKHFKRPDNHWSYITIPIRKDQMDQSKWQAFFDECQRLQLIPLVRLVTEFDPNKGAWEKPSRHDVVEFAEFFSDLNWPTTKRHIIIFNEPNHDGEWGGEISPEEYADILQFSLDWFETESYPYEVIPAGLDAAAPNGPKTMDSFRFIDKMFAARPQLVEKLTVWNSHAYPNPAFSASAYRSAKNGIDGWKYELNYLNDNYQIDLNVYITETGWDQRGMSQRLLTNYYKHALNTAWNDERILAVTPFILKGQNGIFDHFSFLNSDGSPTPQMKALIAAKEEIRNQL